MAAVALMRTPKHSLQRSPRSGSHSCPLTALRQPAWSQSAVRERNGKLFTVADALVLANEILLFRKYVGIEVVDVRRVVVLQKPFENGGGTGAQQLCSRMGSFTGSDPLLRIEVRSL